MKRLVRLLWRAAARTDLGVRLGLDRAYRRECFRRFVEAKRLAVGSENRRDHEAVARAYRDLLRSGLRESESARLEREDEIARLAGDNAQMRAILAERGQA